MYFTLPSWWWPSEAETCCQIRDIRLTSCADSNLFLALWVLCHFVIVTYIWPLSEHILIYVTLSKKSNTLITKLINCIIYSIYMHCLFELWCAHLVIWVPGMNILYVFCVLWGDTVNCCLGNCFMCVIVVYCIFVTCIACIVFCDLYCLYCVLWLVLLVLCFAVMFWLLP